MTAVTVSGGEKLLEAMRRQDEMLVRKGRHATSEAWWQVLSAFLLANVLRAVLRLGRQAGKSTTMERLATAIGVFVDHPIARGTRGVIAFVSVKRSEAAERLHGIASILDDLGVKYERREDEIVLRGRPIVFRVYTASFRTAVGMTLLALFMDEVSRWRDEDHGSNPASEVYASMVPAGVTQPHFRVFMTSSPLGLEDFHAKCFELGDNETQRAFQAASWAMNPTISLERTKELQPDEKLWRREYLAEPQEGVSSAFNMAHVDTAMSRERRGTCPGVVVSADFSSGGGDTAAWIAAGWVFPVPPDDAYLFSDVFETDPRTGEQVRIGRVPVLDARERPVLDPKAAPQWKPCLTFYDLRAIDGKFRAIVSADEIVFNVANYAKHYGARRVVADQHAEFLFESAFRRQGVTFESVVYTQQSKEGAVMRLRQLLRDEMIALPNDPDLRRELAHFREIVTPSGNVRYEGRRSRDDRVATLLTAAIGDAEGLIPGTPLRRVVGGKTYASADARQ